MAATLAGLLWDVDGTLAETELHGHRLAFNAALAEAGLPWQWDIATYLQLLAVGGGRERLAFFLSEAEGTRPDSRRLDALVASKQAHYAELVAAGELALRPGVERLIRAAAAAGLPQAIVTTSSRQAVGALASTCLAPLRDAFSFWICGEDVGAKKPDPEAYRLAIQQLGAAAAQVLVLEDSEAGLAAASGAGLACLVTVSAQSREGDPARFARARAVVDELGDGVRPTRVLQGPACTTGLVTLSYLERLLQP
jgi:HAD superfamily hydrolase (TIGR01509 family)